MDDGGDSLVAWLALGVAVASLGWQVVDAALRRRTKIGVRVHHLALPASVPNGPELLSVPALGLDDRPTVWPSDEPLDYVVAIVVTNDGASTEYVEDIRIAALDGSVGSGASDGSGARELPPRDRVTWAFRAERASFDLEEGFQVGVALASGKTISGGAHALEPELLETIAHHNAEYSDEATTSTPAPPFPPEGTS